MKNGFTLSEVLISLVIIGVIAAITVPSIIQNTREKEFEAALKKNWSVIQNALRRGQLDEGALGDNSAVFTPDSSADRHYNTAKNLAKYLNTLRVCKNSSDTNCSSMYYKINYATNYNGGSTTYNSYAAIALNDGAIYKVFQYPECKWVQNSCVQDSDGNCIKDSSGNTIPKTVNRDDCGLIFIDVNGRKGPNKYGKDVFNMQILNDGTVRINTWVPWAGKKQRKWLYGAN